MSNNYDLDKLKKTFKVAVQEGNTVAAEELYGLINELSGQQADASIAPEPTAPPEPVEYGGVIGGTMRAGGQGLTAGASDEIYAGLGAGFESLLGDDRPYGEIYDELLMEERARMSQFSEDHPAIAVGAEITGAVISPLTKLTAALKVAKMGVMGNTALQAGAVGIPYAFLSSDGTVTERVEDAATAAVVAPLFGVVGQKFINVSLPVAQKVWGGITKGTKPLPKTTAGLQKAKDNAYQLVSDHGVRFSGSSINKSFNDFLGTVQKGGNYVGAEDKAATVVINMFKNLVPKARGRGVELKDIDRLQQNMWKRYNGKATEEPEKIVILDAINSLDDLLLKHSNTSEVMTVARLAAKQFKKAQAFDNIKKAIDIDAAGKNIDQLTRYKTAVSKILKDPKQARFYEESETKLLNEFLESNGSLTNEFLTRVGKFSPVGQLMVMVHGGAFVNTGGLSGIGTAALMGSKKAGARGRNKLGPQIVEAMKGNIPPKLTPSPIATGTAAASGGMLIDMLNADQERLDTMNRRMVR